MVVSHQVRRMLLYKLFYCSPGRASSHPAIVSQGPQRGLPPPFPLLPGFAIQPQDALFVLFQTYSSNSYRSRNPTIKIATSFVACVNAIVLHIRSAGCNPFSCSFCSQEWCFFLRCLINLPPLCVVRKTALALRMTTSFRMTRLEYLLFYSPPFPSHRIIILTDFFGLSPIPDGPCLHAPRHSTLSCFLQLDQDFARLCSKPNSHIQSSDFSQFSWLQGPHQYSQ